MMNRFSKHLMPHVAIALAALVVLLLPGTRVAAEHEGIEGKKLVGENVPAYEKQDKLSGRITIGGSETMHAMLIKLANQFSTMYPDVKLAVEEGGSSAAIRQFVIGYSSQRRGEKSRSGHDAAAQTKVLASSREMTAKELGAFRSRYGYDPLVIPIAMDGVAIYVHRDNPIQGLTLEHLEAIYSKQPSRSLQPVARWGQLGLREGWEQAEIRLYGRDRNSGTHDFFELVGLSGGSLKDEVIMKQGPASEILAIANDPQGIGFAGIGFNTSLVRVLPLAKYSDGEFVMPTAQTVQDGSYPLSRYLYLYVNQSPKSHFDPVLREFLNFVNSREGQTIIANSDVYPLPETVLVKNLAVLKGSTVTAARR